MWTRLERQTNDKESVYESEGSSESEWRLYRRISYRTRSKAVARLLQGCCLPPVLFSLYTEMMMLEALENIGEGVKIGGRSLSDIRFADDQAMISGTQKDFR